MPLDDIVRQARALLGNSPDVNEAALEAACAAAANELASRLRDDAAPDSIPVFSTAAAFLALSLYGQLSDIGGVSSVRVGSISVSKRDANYNPALIRQLRSQADAMLAPYLCDDSFFFLGVDA